MVLGSGIEERPVSRLTVLGPSQAGCQEENIVKQSSASLFLHDLMLLSIHSNIVKYAPQRRLWFHTCLHDVPHSRSLMLVQQRVRREVR
jgi:hypothetical protein